MAVFDRDPFVELLRLRERAEEDVYFQRRDRELIDRDRALRRQREESRVRQLAHHRCPDCGAPLQDVLRRGITIETCPNGHGMWVPPGALEEIPAREHDAWFDRYVHMRW